MEHGQVKFCMERGVEKGIWATGAGCYLSCFVTWKLVGLLILVLQTHLQVLELGID